METKLDRIETVRDVLVSVRDEERMQAQDAIDQYHNKEIATKSRAYKYATRAVAADFLLRTLDKDGLEGMNKALDAVASWKSKADYPSPITEILGSPDQRVKFILPDNIKAHFDAALNDAANVYAALPSTSGRQLLGTDDRHITNLDEHNNELIGRRKFIKIAAASSAATALGLAGLSTTDHAYQKTTRTNTDDKSSQPNALQEKRQSNALGKTEQAIAAALGSSAAITGISLAVTHSSAKELRKTVPQIVNAVADVAFYNSEIEHGYFR